MKKELAIINIIKKGNNKEYKGWINHNCIKESDGKLHPIGEIGRELERLSGNGINVLPDIRALKLENFEDDYLTDGEVSVEYYNGNTLLKFLSGTYLITYSKGYLNLYITKEASVNEVVKELRNL